MEKLHADSPTACQPAFPNITWTARFSPPIALLILTMMMMMLLMTEGPYKNASLFLLCL